MLERNLIQQFAQVLMDRQVVNHKLYDKMKKLREENEPQKMTDIGSCSHHHILQGWFKANYINLTNNIKFQFSLRGTRWIMEIFVADRLPEIWPPYNENCELLGIIIKTFWSYRKGCRSWFNSFKTRIIYFFCFIVFTISCQVLVILLHCFHYFLSSTNLKNQSSFTYTEVSRKWSSK